jgi:chemotaxis protein methyltransferase CheR
MYQDIIFCRNVTIYFDESTTRQIVAKFYRALSEDGWLIVGHAEPQQSIYADFQTYNFENTTLYRREKHLALAPQSVAVSTTPSTTTALPTTTKPLALPPPALPQLPPVTLTQVRQALDQGQWDAAFTLLSRLERDQPLLPIVHYLRGLALYHTHKLEVAKQALRRALYCDPQFGLAHYLLGEIYAQQGLTHQAQRCWEQARQTLIGKPDDEILFAEDHLTVEMFRSLLDIRQQL